MSERVPVPERVLEGLLAVRESGAVNMFDRPQVEAIAQRMGFAETAAWIRAKPDQYARGVFRGFEPNHE